MPIRCASIVSLRLMEMVFLISLPRSGSTLLQRLLMGHSRIASCGEPWLALPIALMDQRDEAFSTYGHFSLSNSVKNINSLMPNGREDFLVEGGKFIQAVYRKIAPDDKDIFLDKTPRYYKIIPELKIMFPTAKFVILTREPSSIFASILNYVDGATYRLPTWRQDIVEGMQLLSSAIQKQDSKTHVVRYEKLVSQPDATLRSLLGFLGLEFEDGILEALEERVVNMGDPQSGVKYQQVSLNSLSSWEHVVNSKIKKRVGLSWMSEVPDKCFASFDTEKEIELNKYKSLSAPTNFKDYLSWVVGCLYFYLGLNVVRWTFARRKNKRHPAVY